MNPITLIQERLRVRSIHYSFIRLANIFKHYGLASIPYAQILKDFVHFTDKYNIVPTFPVTAIAVHRHPFLFRNLQDRGVEFAIHGYRHVDYTQLNEFNMSRHLEKAIQIFKQAGIEYYGFRFPFLRRDPDYTRIVSNYDFLWESSEVVSWPLSVTCGITDIRQHDYKKMIESYQVLDSTSNVVLPWSYHGLIEVPVSMPDDDLLVERLGLSMSQIRDIWRAILKNTYDRGEVFVLQLHPERFPVCKKSLAGVMQAARSFQDIWIAPLRDIAQWWKARMRAQYRVTSNRSGFWSVHFNDKDDLGIEIGIPRRGADELEWIAQPDPPINIHAKAKPVIGLEPPVSQEMIDILRQEGYLFEEMREGDSYAIQFKGDSFSREDRAKLDQRILLVKNPLLRFKRWPANYRSALSITGDIDGIDLWDYWTRFYGS